MRQRELVARVRPAARPCAFLPLAGGPTILAVSPDSGGIVQPTRREFLKVSTLGGVAASVLGFDLAPAYAAMRELKIARTTETRSTCPYCSVSCGVIIHTLGDRARNVTPTVVHVEGDADHPINRGTLCPKGTTLKHNIVNDRRLTKVLYRAPRSAAWEER